MNAFLDSFFGIFGMAAKTSFSCLMADCSNNLISNNILKWGRDNIRPEDLAADGYEDDVHTTILYGLYTDDWYDVISLLKNIRPFDITLGQISKFDSNPDFDVIKLEVISPVLNLLNKRASKLPNKNSFPTYIPHLTIAYVKKGCYNNLVGNNTFLQQKIRVSDLIFSNSEKIHNIIPLIY